MKGTTPLALPKVSLENLKIAKNLSEETTAFTADILCNGVGVYSAKNNGQGGSNIYYNVPATPAIDILKEKVNDEASLYCIAEDGVAGYEMLDQYVAYLMELADETKMVKKLAKKWQWSPASSGVVVAIACEPVYWDAPHNTAFGYYGSVEYRSFSSIEKAKEALANETPAPTRIFDCVGNLLEHWTVTHFAPDAPVNASPLLPADLSELIVPAPAEVVAMVRD